MVCWWLICVTNSLNIKSWLLLRRGRRGFSLFFFSFFFSRYVCVNVRCAIVWMWGRSWWISPEEQRDQPTHTHTPPVRLNSVFIYHFVPFITTWLCALCVCAALCSVFMFTDFDWPAVLTVILISVPFILFFHCLLGLLIKWLFKVKRCWFFILVLSLKRVLLIHHFVGKKSKITKHCHFLFLTI